MAITFSNIIPKYILFLLLFEKTLYNNAGKERARNIAVTLGLTQVPVTSKYLFNDGSILKNCKTQYKPSIPAIIEIIEYKACGFGYIVKLNDNVTNKARQTKRYKCLKPPATLRLLVLKAIYKAHKTTSVRSDTVSVFVFFTSLEKTPIPVLKTLTPAKIEKRK
jgi:hypothetical protein